MPTSVQQRFGKSAESPQKKQQLINELAGRRIGSDGLLLICGETNVVTMQRASGLMRDPLGFVGRLDELGINVILNPVHDYMRRHEMMKKRQFLSRQGRTVLSVWNQGKGKGEAHLPWAVFHDGENRIDAVKEVLPRFPDRPDIRIGIVDLEELRGRRRS